MFFHRALTVLLTSLVVTSVCVGEETQPPASAVMQAADARMQIFAADGGGGAVIIEVGGELLLRKGYGLADRERGIPFTPETIAQIGSLTKQFTATAALMLAEEGKLDPQATVKTYLKAAPEPMASVTIHQLLTHTAGLPEYCGDDFAHMTLDEMLNGCLSQPLLFEPGAKAQYSNAGYSVVAAVIEAVSKKNLDALLREHVLEPNGLLHTGYAFPHPEPADFAHGYLNGVDQGVISDRIASLGDAWWNLKGNGGMQASSDDMYRWRRVLSGDGALDPNVVALLRTPQTPWEDGVAEGYGWFFRDEGTGKVRQMSHSGSDGVFFSYYWDRPEDGVFMYFVGNSGEAQVLDALRDVRAVLIEAYVANPSQH